MGDAKDLVKRQFAGAGDAYVRSELHANGDDLQQMVEIAGLQGNERVLDIATGGGHVARAFSPWVKEVIASDLTPEILAHAHMAFERWGLGNVGLAVADAEDLPFRAGSFDIVTCRIAAHHFPDPGAFVAEAARVLRDGGLFLLVDSTVPKGDDGAWFNHLEKVRDHSHVRSLTIEEWRELITRNGFEHREMQSFPKRHDFDQWLERSRTEDEDRRQLVQLFGDATVSQQDKFVIEYRDSGDVLAFTDLKTLFHAIKPAN